MNKNLEPKINVKTVAIVGLGATGTAFYSHLVDELVAKNVKNIKVVIFDRLNESLCSGVAYSYRVDSLILNMPASTMSVKQHDPNDFVDFLKKSGHSKYDGSSYPPRHIYGDYLRSVFEKTLLKARHNGISTHCIFEKVVDITKNDDRYKVQTQTEIDIPADFVFMASGYLEPEPHSKEIKDNQKYINYPYDLKKVGKIEKSATVGIIGASLTAVDIALFLSETGHSGKMHFISRNGYLPGAQTKSQKYKLQIITEENLIKITNNWTKELRLSEVVDLIRSEFELAINKKVKINNRQQLLKLQDSPELKSIINSTVEVISKIWNCLPDKDKITFFEKYGSLWASFRHCMPKSNYIKINNMIDDKNLKVHSSKEKFVYDKKTNKFINKDIGLEVDFLINCIGTSYDFDLSKNVLLKNMLRKGLVSKHSCRGINVDFNTHALLDNNNQAVPNIYFVGPLTMGVHFYTNAIEKNSPRAQSVARQIVSKIRQTS